MTLFLKLRSVLAGFPRLALWIVAGFLFLGLFGDSGVAIATLLMTVLLVIFSEVLPKSWAISTPARLKAAQV